MGSTPDVRVRLSAEGELSIINAFKRIQAQANQTGKIGASGLNALTNAASRLASFLPALTFAGAIAGAVALAKRALETGDQFAKLSQRTGVSVEVLSSYAHGAALADIDTETLAISLGRLSRTMNAAAQGVETAKQPFRDLGVEFRTQQGTLRPLDIVLGDIADKFVAMPDGPRKAALAIELFGRSGDRMIPFLNEGRAGLEEIRREAERLGLVFSTDAAQAIERVADDMKRLGGAIQGLVNQLLAGAAPAMADFAESLLATSNQAGAGKSQFQELGETVGKVAKFIVAAFFSAGLAVGDFFLITGRSLAAFGLLEDDLLHRRFKGSIDRFRATLREEFDAIRMESKLTLDTFVARLNLEADKTPGRKPKPKAGGDAPIDDEAARTRALDAARKFADAQLAMEKGLLDNELALAKANNAAHLAVDQERFKAGLTNLQDFFAKRRAMLESEAAKEIAIAEQQVAAIQDRLIEAQKRPRKKGETQADRDAENLKLTAELEKAVTEVEVRRIVLVGERAKLESENREAVRTFNQEELTAQAQLLNAQGQRFRAARLELDAQVAGLKRLAGESDAELAARQNALRKAGDEQIRRDEKQVALSAEGQLFEAEGQRFEAERIQLESQIVGMERLTSETDQSFANRQQFLREAGEARIRFEEIQAEARTSLSELESSRIQIEMLVTRGVITEHEGQVAIAQLEKDRLPVLRQIAVAMKAAAVTPEQIETARQFADQLDQLAASADLAGQRMAEFKKAVGDALTSDLANFFSHGIDEATSFGDAMRRLAASVVQSLREIASQMLANLIIQGLMGAFLKGATSGTIGGAEFGSAGAAPGAASGGLVRGPGSGTSDSIPIRVSTGEYITRAAVVAQPGVLPLLETLNAEGIAQFYKDLNLVMTLRPRPMPRARNYARGGLVVDGEPGQTGRASIDAQFAVEEGVIIKRLSGSKEFERIVVRAVANNPRAVRALLR